MPNAKSRRRSERKNKDVNEGALETVLKREHFSAEVIFSSSDSQEILYLYFLKITSNRNADFFSFFFLTA